MALWHNLGILLLFILDIVGLSEADLDEDNTCGGFKDISWPGATGFIHSPNFPNKYPPQSNCIWLLQAPSNYSIELVIKSLKGQNDSYGNCVDYLLVTNGSSTSTVIYDQCFEKNSVTLTSYSRWMWIKFFSGDIGDQNLGFQASWSIVPSVTSQLVTVSPIVACLSVSYQCPNMECISWSYVCDGINDCGYLQSGSDEIGCNGLGWSKAKKIGVGVGTGVGVFCVIFFGIGFTDIIIRERARRKYLEEMERKRRLAKKRKAEAKAAGQLDVSANTSRRGSSNFLATPGLMSRQVSSTSTVTT